MTIESFISELQAAKSIDIVKARERFLEEFVAAKTSGQRAQLLAVVTATISQVQRHLVARGDKAGELESLRKAWAYDYKSILVQECTVGLDSPGASDVCAELLMAVTNREIAAGRMTEEHSLRQLAVKAAAAPHLSQGDLLAKHAKLKAEAARAQANARVSKTSADKSATAYAFGNVLGKELRGLFWK